MKKFVVFAVILTLAVALVPMQGNTRQTEAQDKVLLTIESWRNDDLAIWEDVIIPAFNAHYPNIEVVFEPAAPTEYNAALQAKLDGGTAGDLITCRPFDLSLDLFKQGHLVSLNDLPGIEHFGSVARSAWITDDGSDVFCVPMASVIHGFLYNVDAFNEVGVEEPATEQEFLDALQAIKDDGLYQPLAMGTVDLWESATMGYQNIGPNYWKGEEGRLGLIEGTIGYDENGFLEAFEALARWQPYMPEGYQAVTYPDSQNLFAFGVAVVFPAGSWDIGTFRNMDLDFEMGAFKPSVPEGNEECYISDHVDIAMGVNADSPHVEEAKIFLEWMTTAEFAELYSNQLPGFFTLSDHSITLEDPIAQEFLDWRNECNSTIRSAYQILSRGEPNNELDLWNYSAQVLNGDVSPEEAATKVQEGLEAWYEPQME